MIIHGAYVMAALILLFAGAEGLVRGSSSMAVRAGLSPLMAGLTIVAFGTSSPELVVSIKSALSHQGDISVGNVVGSNSFNIGIILGLTALICPIPVNLQVIKIDAPVALGVSILLPVLLANQVLGRVEGLVLFAGIILYAGMSIHLGRSPGAKEQGNVSIPPVSRHWTMDAAFILAGLGILVLGSRLLVDHAAGLARDLGVGEAVIGLTIVAAGTSMPELATSLVAAFRKQPDIAVGNVVGSNIFNILGILGVASVVSPLHAPGISGWDYGVMIMFSALVIPLFYTGRLLHRLEGTLLVVLYSVYLFFLLP